MLYLAVNAYFLLTGRLTVIARLFKIAMQVRQTRQRIILHLPSACAVKQVLHTLAERLFISLPANVLGPS